MKLSVIILNHNVRYFLELCLLSVTKAIESIDAEVIVVDNASKDDSVAMLSSKFPDIKLIRNPINVGFSKANNQGVSEAKGDYICILNPDTVVGESIFKNLFEFSDTKSNLGIIGCRLIDGAGHFLPESKRNIPKPNVALKKLLGIDKQYYANNIDQTDSAKVPILTGAFMFMEKKVFNDVHGFDEDYFMYGEDIDLSYKVLKDGRTNYYVGSETIIHFKGESTVKNAKYLKNFYGSMKIFYHKHFQKHRLYDFLIDMGVRILPYFKNVEERDSRFGDKVVMFSEYDLPTSLLDMDIKSLKESICLKNWDTLIFNTSCYSFDLILSTIQRSAKEGKRNFRFYLPGSGCIVGSDGSTAKGHIQIMAIDN